MNEAENELLTRTGPGTPCGELMRRYWQPAALLKSCRQALLPCQFNYLAKSSSCFATTRESSVSSSFTARTVAPI